MNQALDERSTSGAASAPSTFVFRDLPAVSSFDALTEPGAYVPLPADWSLGLADVVTSTAAIEAGRYKAVNTAGAAVIAAVSNALGTLDFPFVFGGDGASFAVAPDQARTAGEALAATVGWVGEALDLELRGALLPVSAIRAAGQDVRIARFAASPDVAYAMFSGGGRSWAETELKAGRLAPAAAPPGSRPDLTGLSCRFEDIEAANGVILSLIVRPMAGADDTKALAVLRRILAVAETVSRSGHPLPIAGPAMHWPPRGLDLEARLHRRPGLPLALARGVVACKTAVAHMIFRRGRDVGRFSPQRYRRQLVDNSDFRKFDDGLMMTLDCTRAAADAIEATLRAAHDEGIVRYGLHRQEAAVVTCMVPSALRADHIHFVDGAAGGYARAARDLKRQAG
ncbi:MAG TPA: DUF3095 domain-containing protein [Lichenihabitans sp.]|nr:DUF3095 domain-containing protein [Lichenihabitans sp.]